MEIRLKKLWNSVEMGRLIFLIKIKISAKFFDFIFTIFKNLLKIESKY
jgi:hypothetical protein